LGTLLVSRGRFREAEEHFTRLLDFHAGDFYTFADLGTAYLGLKRWSEAATYLQRALERNQDSSWVLTQLGWANACHGDIPAARKYFDEALSVRNSPYTQNNLAWALAECEADLEYALENAALAVRQAVISQSQIQDVRDWKSGFQAQESLSGYLDTYGWVLFKLGRPADAEPYLNAASLLTANKDVFEHLRDVEIVLGKRVEAAIAHRTAATLAGSSPIETPTEIEGEVAQARSRLDTSGWILIEKPELELKWPAEGESDDVETVFVVCLVSKAGRVQDSLFLDGKEPWLSAVQGVIEELRVKPISWNDETIQTFRLIRVQYHPDRRVTVQLSTGGPPLLEAYRLMPDAVPEEQLSSY
jgi:tetratricopeptide (TPR) repeat protein